MTTAVKGKPTCTGGENTAPLPLSAQQRTCRCCNGQMEASFQPALLPGRPGYWLLTCWNTCDLNGYTFTNNTYPTVDLEPYLVK